MQYTVEPSAIMDGTLSVPGDKSISHRALLLGAIARGDTRIHGFLPGQDCVATMAAMTELGVDIDHSASTEVRVRGVGLDGLKQSETRLDLGNSGTAMRLLAGLLAGQPFESTLTGDASLRSRPMQRVITPLQRMGARFSSAEGGRPPLTVRGRRPLKAIEYALPIASAQVKSALLLAGLYTEGVTRIAEPAITRDHTERMLRSMGVAVQRDGSTISVAGGQAPVGRNIEVPGDLSSAAFVILAALIANDAEVLITNVGINRTRTGGIAILQSMGADILLENERRLGEEPVADIRVRSSRLTGKTIDPGMVSLAIDEFPVLFIAAAAASGRSHFSGLEELRHKESDRIAVMAQGLRALGISVDETPDGAVIHGGRFAGGIVDSHGDHRVAMALAVAGTVAAAPVTIRDVAAVGTSFPGFPETLAGIGARLALAAT